MKPIVKPYKSISMFENSFLEKFTHIHPLTPLVFWSPYVSYLLWKSYLSDVLSVFSFLGLAVAGWLSWTLAEYLLHRFLFHFKGSGPVGERIHFLLHGFHHVDAGDATRLVMS